jgi:ATP-dependent Lhr-like helicase
MGAPKGSSRLLQRIGRANHGWTSRARRSSSRQPLRISGSAGALDAIDGGELDPEIFRPGALDVLAQHVMAAACAAPFREEEMLEEVRSAAPYAGLSAGLFRQVLEYIESGGYSLKAYDRFRA